MSSPGQINHLGIFWPFSSLPCSATHRLYTEMPEPYTGRTVLPESGQGELTAVLTLQQILGKYAFVQDNGLNAYVSPLPPPH